MKKLTVAEKNEIYDFIRNFIKNKPSEEEWLQVRKNLAQKYNISEGSIAAFRSIHREVNDGTLNKRIVKAWKKRRANTKMIGIPILLHNTLLEIGKTINSSDVNDILRTLIANFKSDSRMINYFKTLEQLKNIKK